MATIIANRPKFDLIEASTDKDLSYKNYHSLSPVKAGGFVSRINFDFAYSRWQNFSNGVADDAFIATKQIYGKPLVISFYSKHWHAKGVEHLKQLSALNDQVKANGGTLVVVSAEAIDEELLDIAFENRLSLNFYFDQNNSIAKQLGVFSDKDPIWNWFAGVDLNVPLLATFVLGTEQNVVFAHNDRDHAEALSNINVINAVRQSAFINNLLLSA